MQGQQSSDSLRAGIILGYSRINPTSVKMQLKMLEGYDHHKAKTCKLLTYVAAGVKYVDNIE